ncbi:MAG TPA: hypothetical protein VFU05_00415 [Cyclobacteriaceae bacterium]|nr:hypothetical protein [Cyclobacteriaceae bacterium]
MDQGIIEIALWLAGGFGTIFMGLLTWIGVMQRESKDQNKTIIELIHLKNSEQDERLNKHDEKFDKVHDEIKSLAVSIATSSKKRK